MRPVSSLCVSFALLAIAAGVRAEDTGGGLPVKLTKTASKAVIRAGEVVSYTVTATHDGTQTLGGAVVLEDRLPSGFALVAGSARFETSTGLQDKVRSEPMAGDPAAMLLGREVGGVLSGWTLAPGARLVVRYQLVPGSSTEAHRTYTNRAVARFTSGAAVSSEARAEVRLEPEAEFDQGMVVGRVFCDTDGDTTPDPDEPGVGGVRVYADHGWYVDTDADGKWHHTRLDPGHHLFKLDVNTLPPGSKPTGYEKRLLLITPGLVGQANFGVTCSFETARPASLKPPAPQGQGDDDGTVELPKEVSPVVTVLGRLGELSLVVDGQPLPALRADLSLEAPTSPNEPQPAAGVRNLPWTARPLPDPLRFQTKVSIPGGAVDASWRLQFWIRTPEGDALVREAFGKGAPPPGLEWDGTDATGALGILVRGGLYRARITVTDSKGGVAMSPPVTFGVSYGGGDEVLAKATWRGRLFDKRGRSTNELGKRLKELRPAVARHPGARLVLEVHTDEGVDPDTDLAETRRAAFALMELATTLTGLPGEQVLSIGYGGTRPIVPNFSERNRAFNRRIEFQLLPPEDPSKFKPVPVMPAKPKVAIQGMDADLDASGAFVGTVARPAGGRLSIELVDHRDARRTAVVTVAKPGTPRPPAGGGEPSPPKPGESPPQGGESTPQPAPPLPKESVSPVGLTSGEEPKLTLQGPDGKPVAPPGQWLDEPAVPLETDPLRRFGGEALRKALETKSVLLGAGPGSGITAGELTLELPPKGLQINTKRLFVRGTAHADNTVTINGKPVHKKQDGSFTELVPLPVGKSDLVIVSTDKAGYRATLTWPVEVADMEFFLLALADGAFGQVEAHLAEESTHHTYDDKDVFVQGRGAVYFKGRVSGDWLVKDLFFTAHLDTARRTEFEAFYEQVIDPHRDYAVFGDASQPVKDAHARGAFYVLVEADRSKLRVGNIRTNLQGIQLFQYHRSFYGVELDVDQTWAEGWRTRVQGFVSDESRRLAPGHDELQGTGGSLYYLSKRDVVEGSERVALVVREINTGLELGRAVLIRDQDYRIAYSDGRLFMKTPVSSTVDAMLALNGMQGLDNRHVLEGHEVWIVVDYETRSRAFGGDLALGVHASQTLSKYLEVGGGYVQEMRAGTEAYQLLGGHLKVNISPETRISFEVAESRASDRLNQLSTDGGLSFSALDRGAGSVAKLSNLALRTDLSSNLGELFGVKDVLDLTVKAHWQLIAPGFHSSGIGLERASEKLGVEILYKPQPNHRVLLRVDHIDLFIDNQPELGLPDPYRENLRTRFGAHYRYFDGRFGGFGEVMYGQHRDDLDGQVFDTGALVAGVSYRILPALEAMLTQEVLLAGAREVFGDDDLAVASTSFGLSYALTQDLALTAKQIVRWNGDNATRIGVRTRLSDATDLYFEERVLVGDDNSELVHSTVLGAQTRFAEDGSGRAWGEYRLDSGVGGRTNRAVFGIGKRFELAPGIFLSGAYERAQTLGGFEGIGARDVVSLGAEILAYDAVKFGGRYELRYDKGDPALGGFEALQAVATNGLDIQVSNWLTLMGILNYTLTQDLTARDVLREAMELSVGIAIRPPAQEWVKLFARYTRRVDRVQDPLTLSNGDVATVETRSIADIATLAAIFSVWRIEITEKLGYKHLRERVSDLGTLEDDYLLWVNRFGIGIWDRIEVAGEYRLLMSFLNDDLRHGLLAEVAYTIVDYVKIAAGYNFSSFSDDLRKDLSKDEGGFFVRVLGMY
jgi:uncharacterized repeat protein (TIGR01451 family)